MLPLQVVNWTNFNILHIPQSLNYGIYMRLPHSFQPVLLEEDLRTSPLDSTRCYENKSEREEENQHHFHPPENNIRRQKA